MVVVGDSDEVASAAATALKRMSPSDVAPALVVTLAPPAGGVRTSFLDLISTWSSSGGLAPDAANAARMAHEANN